MPNTTPDDTPDNPHGSPLVALMPAALILVLTVWGWAEHREPESRVWIPALFIAPCVLQFVGLWTLRQKPARAFWQFNYLATFLCQGSYCLLWIMYSSEWETSQWLSYLALAWIFLPLLVFVTIMTFAIMRKHDDDDTLKKRKDPQTRGTGAAPPGGSKPGERKPSFSEWREEYFRGLSVGVGENPFWAIMLFMALFLGVSYLFGFALAFHDKHIQAKDVRKPALYMAKRESDDDKHIQNAAGGQGTAGGADNTGGGQSSAGPAPTPGAGTPPPSEQRQELRFHFEEMKANVNQNKYGCNTCRLEEITKKLTEKLEQGRRVKVMLLGHTDNEPIRVAETTPVRYLSNYELSEARAQNVQYEILRRLPDNLRNPENIQWAIYPAADEPLAQVNHGVLHKVASGAELEKFQQNEKREDYIELIDRRLPKEEKRVVIATIDLLDERPIVIRPEQIGGIVKAQEQQLGELQKIRKEQENYAEDSKPKPLRLMDYMYFSIYTITTTGYGDIVPNTAYAKFLTSVANIFEVIFLVVFFNAILSLKGSGGSKPTADEGAAEKSEGDAKPDNAERADSPFLNSRPRRAG